MSEKKRYMKITDGGSMRLIAEIEFGLAEIKMICGDMTEGEEWTFGIVEMTDKEIADLPEHPGW
jgi:hypothetical protein